MTGLTMIVTRLEMAGETWNYAEATVYWQGKPVGESLWVYESWQDRWNYAGDSRDVWADDDLCTFLDQHDTEETENVGAEIGPEDLRVLVAGAVERFERLDWD